MRVVHLRATVSVSVSSSIRRRYAVATSPSGRGGGEEAKRDARGGHR